MGVNYTWMLSRKEPIPKKWAVLFFGQVDRIWRRPCLQLHLLKIWKRPRKIFVILWRFASSEAILKWNAPQAIAIFERSDHLDMAQDRLEECLQAMVTGTHPRTIKRWGWVRFLKGKISERIQLRPSVLGARPSVLSRCSRLECNTLWHSFQTRFRLLI